MSSTDTRRLEAAEKNVARLTGELDEANEHIRQLEERLEPEMRPHPLAVRAKLTPSESRLFHALLRSPTLRRDRAFAQFYSEEDRHPKVLDVFIHKLRKKLRPHHVTICTHWGVGWFIDPDDRFRLLEME